MHKGDTRDDNANANNNNNNNNNSSTRYWTLYQEVSEENAPEISLLDGAKTAEARENWDCCANLQC